MFEPIPLTASEVEYNAFMEALRRRINDPRWKLPPSALGLNSASSMLFLDPVTGREVGRIVNIGNERRDR
jgi:hypothetical protein